MRKLTLPLACSLIVGACSDLTAPMPSSRTHVPSLASTPGETECRGVLPAGVYGNIVVPPGATCMLSNSVVQGNVTAMEDSRLVMFNDQVEGNVEGVKADGIEIFAFPLGAGTVKGNIQIREATTPQNGPVTVFINNIEVTTGNVQIEKNSATGIVIINNTVMKGNVQIQENSTLFFHNVRDNRVAQNMQIFKNSGSGPLSIENNSVGGNLQCFENAGVIIGGPNAAQKAEGQCF